MTGPAPCRKLQGPVFAGSQTLVPLSTAGTRMRAKVPTGTDEGPLRKPLCTQPALSWAVAVTGPPVIHCPPIRSCPGGPSFLSLFPTHEEEGMGAARGELSEVAWPGLA